MSSLVFSQTSTKIGNTYYHSDGTSSSKIGNTIYNSDGSSGSKIGNTIYKNNNDKEEKNYFGW